MPLNIRSHLIRTCPGHRTYMPVKFYSDINNRYLTIPIKENNVLLATCNDHINEIIKTQEPDIKVHEHPILVPKAIADHMALDLIVVFNAYCDIKKKDEVYELYYSVCSHTPISIHRQFLIGN